MPIYEYECCGEKFELLRPIRQAQEEALCPNCSKSVSRIVSPLGKPLVASPFTVISHDGTVLSRTQTTERTPFKKRHRWTGKVVNA